MVISIQWRALTDLKNILGKSYIAWDFCIYNGVLENALSRRLSYMYLKVSVSLYRRQCKVAVEVDLLNAPVKRIMKLAIKRTHWLLFPAPFLIYVIPSLKARETYWQNPFLFPTGLELHADFNSALYYDSGRWRHCYPAILVLPTGSIFNGNPLRQMPFIHTSHILWFSCNLMEAPGSLTCWYCSPVC